MIERVGHDRRASERDEVTLARRLAQLLAMLQLLELTSRAPDAEHGWRYAGRVGSGFSDTLLAELSERLSGSARKPADVHVDVDDPDLWRAHWVKHSRESLASRCLWKTRRVQVRSSATTSSRKARPMGIRSC